MADSEYNTSGDKMAGVWIRRSDKAELTRMQLRESAAAGRRIPAYEILGRLIREAVEREVMR